MSDTPQTPGSLADRISQPVPSINGSSTTFSPLATTGEAKEHSSWADEVASPAAGDDKSEQLGGQVDGTAADLGGSDLQEAQYDVEVTLSDIQGDVNSPLFSSTTFDDLGLQV
jgi:ATP-dependent RNA helicase DDX19/DBP5